MRHILIAATTLLGAGAAQAHVVISPAMAPAGGYYFGELRVSHGCDGSPTVALRVEIPAGVVAAWRRLSNQATSRPGEAE